MKSNPIAVFSKDNGNSDYYRIPSIIKTNSGILVCACDERYFSEKDYPNRTDKVVKRSLDQGKTWSQPIYAVKSLGKDLTATSIATDPCLLYDDEKNIIYMIYTHTPHGIGILNAKKGKGVTNSNQIILTNNNKNFYLEHNKIYNMDKTPTDYIVNNNGDVFLLDKYLGNIYTYTSEFKEYPTYYLYITQSFDEGLTWTIPKCLNGQVKLDIFSFIGAGPGIGLKLKDNLHKGRLLFPIYYNTTNKPPLCMSSALIYSDDNGDTWKLGNAPISSKTIFGFNVNPYYHPDCLNTTECQFVELDNGIIRVFLRNHSLKRFVAMADSLDGGISWENFKYNKNLIHPICQHSIIKIHDKNEEVLVFVNSADKKRRINGTIRLSYDGGNTFKYSRIIKEGEFVYSSIVELDNHNIGILYEPSTLHHTIEYTEVSLDWIKGMENG